MRYHLFLNSFRKMFKIAKVFSRKLAVPRYMSTSVAVVDCTSLLKIANPKKTGPWNGHSSVIFPSLKPEGISKNGNNTICLA